MLLKILTIVVIAWFVVRAARNLLRAVIHDQGIPESRVGGPSARDSDRDTFVHRRTDTMENRANRSQEENVEDATYRDI